MSDHSKPRRWKMRWTSEPGVGWLVDGEMPEKFDTASVREDCITEAESEAVKRLIERSDIYDVDDQVREIAAIFFEGGEQS